MNRSLTVLAACALACRPPAPLERPEPVDIHALGTPAAFGRGILAAHPGALLVDLSTRAHVIVVRVWPREGSELIYPVGTREWRGYNQTPREFREQALGRGEHTLVLPIRAPFAVSHRLRSTPAPWRPRERGFPTQTCALRPAATASPAPARVYCYYLRLRDPLDPPLPGQYDPQPLEPHYLVVLAGDTAFDVAWVRDQIERTEIAGVRGEAGALAMAQVLAGERRRWAAWIVQP